MTTPLDPLELADAATTTAPSKNGSRPDTGEKPPRFKILHADELTTLPPIDYLDEGKEIPKGRFVVNYGPSGVGKSQYVQDHAERIAQHHPVVYVAAEGAEGYASRVLAWCNHFKMGNGQLHFIGEAVNLLDPADVQTFINAVLPVKPVLIVIDTLARCMLGGDENSARDMGLFVASCDQIRIATGATVLVVHHTGKSGASERGSSALRAACDQMIELSDEGDGLIIVQCTKSKDSKPFPKRALRRVENILTGRTLPDGTPETSCVLEPSDRVIMAGELTPIGRKLLEILFQETFRNTGARSKTLLEVTQMKPSTMYASLSKLLKDGYVRQHEKGDPYYITAQGELTIGGTLSTPKHSKVE